MMLQTFGVEWLEIAAMTSMRPAAWLGLEHIGSIATGCAADFVTFRGQALESVWIDGEAVRLN